MFQRHIWELIGSVNTGAFIVTNRDFTAICLRESYATTNFLDPDFWDLSQKVRLRLFIRRFDSTVLSFSPKCQKTVPKPQRLQAELYRSRSR